MNQLVEFLTPISADSPSGLYLRHAPLYDQIKEARREDDDLTREAGHAPRKLADWPQVIRLSSEALQKKTKDLQVAAWLTEAWLHREGFPGLHRGLQLIHELLTEYWPTLYPPIEEGDTDLRAAPLSWLSRIDAAVRLAPLNRLGHSLVDQSNARSIPTREEAKGDSQKAALREQAIQKKQPTPEDIEQGFTDTTKDWFRSSLAEMDGSTQTLLAIETFCEERFVEPPNFLGLRSVLEEVRQSAAQFLARKLELEPEQPQGGASTPPGDTSAGASPGPEGPRPATPMETARVDVAAGPRSVDEAGTWIAAAARKLRQERPSDPASYLLIRGFRWGELRSEAGTIDPRLLHAPPTELRVRLKGLLLDANWGALLHAGEDAVAQPYGRGWLDLQRYVLTAVDGMGPGYGAVGKSIRTSLRSLLDDVPDLVSQTLMDDSATANNETRIWLQEEGLLGAQAPSDVAVARPATSRRDAYDVALARLQAGDGRGAMELLMREASQEKSARARFLRRAQAADIMVGSGMDMVALPMLRELVSLIDTHRLEDWEAGDTVAQPIALLYKCAKQLQSGDIDTGKLYERICRLDPVRAVELRTESGSDEKT